MNAYKTNCIKTPTSYWGVDNSISVDALNPSFENFLNGYTPPALGSFAITDADNIEGWETDEPNNQIEVWTDGFIGVPAYDGSYFIEMNVNSPARLFQKLAVPNGKGVLSWQVAHRARGGATTINNAEVIIAENIDGVLVDNVVQVMSSPGGEWTVYSGVFTKPCGVTEVEIAFNSLDAGGFGNFLDGVQLNYTAYNETCDEGYHDGCGNLYDVDDALLDPDSYTLCNPNCYASEGYVDDAVTPETITTLATPTVDNTDPLNPVVTLDYTNEDGSQTPVDFTFNIPTPASVINSIDLKPTANPNELTVEIVYTDDNGATQTITDTTAIDLSNLESPWDNPDGSVADQTSGDIEYNDGNVTIGQNLLIDDQAWASATSNAISIGKTQDTHQANETTYGIDAGEGSTGPHSTIIGYLAGRNSTANSLTAVGRNAGDGNTGASNLVAIGVNAGLGNSGNSVVGIGTNSAMGNTGNNVIAVGDVAAFDNTGGNVAALGLRAAQNNTGVNVSVVGQTTGSGNTGSNVSAVGASAALSNTGSNVNGLGVNAARANTGSNVVALGLSAGANNTQNSRFIVNNSCLPSFSDRTAALATITVALGAPAGNTYMYYNASTGAIEGVRL